MSVITFLPFISTRFIMDLSYLRGKGHESAVLLFLSISLFFFFYNLLAVIYDNSS